MKSIVWKVFCWRDLKIKLSNKIDYYHIIVFHAYDNLLEDYLKNAPQI